MQGLVPVGTNRFFLLFRWVPQAKGDCRQVAFAFWKVQKDAKITFAKAKKMLKTVFKNIDFEYNLVFVNIIFAIKTIFLDIIRYCC